MKAGVVTPGQKDSARVVEMDAPVPRQGEVMVKTLEVGIDGTDMEINQGHYGESPPGQDFLVLGHEALAEVEKTGGAELHEGDLVVPLATARDTARRTAGELVVVHGATHSFMLQDPETLPAIVRELLAGDLGAACAQAVLDAGLDPTAPLSAVDDAFAPAGTPLRRLGPPELGPRPVPAPRTPHYRWSRSRPAIAGERTA